MVLGFQGLFDESVDALRRSVSVGKGANMALVSIRAENADPVAAARIANLFANRYVQGQRAAMSLRVAAVERRLEDELSGLQQSGAGQDRITPLQTDLASIQSLDPTRLGFAVSKAAMAADRPFFPPPLGRQILLALVAGLVIGGLAVFAKTRIVARTRRKGGKTDG